MSGKRNYIILCFLAILLILLRIPSLDEPLDNDSGAVAYHARLVMNGEPLYSTHHPGHHMPGAFYTYVLAFRLFGDQQFAPKMLLLPWMILISWTLYYLGRKISGEITGVLAAVFFTIGTSQVMLKGMTAEPELFANLPITLSVVFLIFLLLKNNHSWLWILAGVLSSLAVIYKLINLAPIATAGIAILVDFWGKRHIKGENQNLLERILWLALGFALPLIILLGYYAEQGLLKRFLMVFTLGTRYVKDFSVQVQPLPLPPMVGFPIFILAFNNIVLLVIGLVASLRLVQNKLNLSTPYASIRAALFSWMLFSLFESGFNTVGFSHYVLLVVPPLSFLAALEISRAYSQMSEKSGKQKANFLAAGMIMLVVLNSIVTNYSIYAHEVAFRLGLETYDQALSERPGTGEIYLKIKPVAEYIQSRTNPADLVYYWGQDAQFYYFANRRSALEYIWPYYAASSEILGNVFAPETKYIILTSPKDLSRPDWLLDGMRISYHYETTIQGIEIYHRENTNESP